MMSVSSEHAKEMEKKFESASPPVVAAAVVPDPCTDSQNRDMLMAPSVYRQVNHMWRNYHYLFLFFKFFFCPICLGSKISQEKDAHLVCLLCSSSLLISCSTIGLGQTLSPRIRRFVTDHVTRLLQCQTLFVQWYFGSCTSIANLLQLVCDGIPIMFANNRLLAPYMSAYY